MKIRPSDQVPHFEFEEWKIEKRGEPADGSPPAAGICQGDRSGEGTIRGRTQIAG